MRLNLFVACLLVGIPGGVASAAPHPSERPRLLWSGPEVRVDAKGCQNTHLDSYPFCIVWSGQATSVSEQIDGPPGFVATLWRETGLKRKPAGAPDFLFYAGWGGSALCGDYVALRFGELPHFQKLTSCRQPEYPADAKPQTGPFGFSLFMPVMMPFGASNAESVATPVPVIWRNGTFALDVARLSLTAFSPDALKTSASTIREETGTLVRPHYAGQGLPRTTRILLDLIFAGHADRALSLLHGSADPSFDSALYWKDLCAILVADSNWTILMHGVLPGASEVEMAAIGGQPSRDPAAYGRIGPEGH